MTALLYPEQESPAKGVDQGLFDLIRAESLGSREFKQDYHLRYAYLAGAMVKGIASEELVIRMGRAGMLGFFGTGGLELDRIEEGIGRIREKLHNGESYGLNLLYQFNRPHIEERMVDLYLRHKVRIVEAAAYVQISPALVRYRLSGLETDREGRIRPANRIIAKVSHYDVANNFLSPAPKRIVAGLLAGNRITSKQAALSDMIPMADDLCVEADSAGHTNQGILMVLLPAIMRLRDEMTEKYGYSRKIRVGAAGGIGTPEAAAAAFILGADFILTGSINQCTSEAGISGAVKDILQNITVQDTGYAPAGDMFELGAKVQVVKKGLFFPARARKLYDLYQRYNSIEEIDPKTRSDIEEQYFKSTMDYVFAETKAYHRNHFPEEIEKAERNPRHKMALIFRRYFANSLRAAIEGDVRKQFDFQIFCGPAMGAFNQWVKGTEIEHWRNRHVDDIGERLMNGAAILLNRRMKEMKGNGRYGNAHLF